MNWGRVAIELLDLVLCEIAGHKPLVLLAPAGQWRQRAGNRLDQRRFAGAVRAEQADAVARSQRQTHLFDDAAFAVADRRFIEGQQRIGQRIRHCEFELDARFRAHRSDRGHPLQRLDPALRLARLGRLRLETIDEALQARSLYLLAFVSDLLLGQAFGTLALVGADVAGEKLGVRVRDMQHVRNDVIEEFAIVRDHNQGAGIAPQPFLEPEHRVEIEMVGRFVEQQQIRAAHQRLGEVEAHAPAARKLGHRAGFVARREAESVQQFAGTCTRRVAADCAQTIVQHGLAGRVVRGFGLGEVAFKQAELGVAVEHVIESGVGERIVVLTHMGERPVARAAEIAAVWRKIAADQCEQAAFARAVAARQADAPARMNEKICAVQQKSGTSTQVQVVEAQHGAKFSVCGTGVCQR